MEIAQQKQTATRKEASTHRQSSYSISLESQSLNLMWQRPTIRIWILKF